MVQEETQAEPILGQRSDPIGGLTLLPIGVLLLLTALGFAQGWLPWSPGYGVPVIGFLAAGLLDMAIRHYYRSRFKGQLNKPKNIGVAAIVLVVGGLVIAWVVDVNLRFAVHVLPLVIAMIFLRDGLSRVRSGRTMLGWVYGVPVILLIVWSFVPLALKLPRDNALFGTNGVIEYTLEGIAFVVIGLIEHRALTQAANP